MRDIEIAALSPAQINEAVARKLGWQEDCLRGYWSRKVGSVTVEVEEDLVPDYCHSIEAAFETVTSFRGDFELRRQNDTYKAAFFRPSEEYEAWDRTAPRAICKAFLKLP